MDGIGSFTVEGAGGHQSPDERGCWEQNWGLLEGQQMLLTSETSLLAPWFLEYSGS